jgi:disulfide bond formation protein DsbB
MSTKQNPLFNFLGNNYLSFGFLITATATVGSLFFSEIMKLPPCDLCWYQRAFIYPQAVLFGLALWKNDRRVVNYILPLSIIGALVALYHNLLQLNPTVLPCTNSVASCATKQIEIGGFDAIPVMSLLAYLTLIGLSILYKKTQKI